MKVPRTCFAVLPLLDVITKSQSQKKKKKRLWRFTKSGHENIFSENFKKQDFLLSRGMKRSDETHCRKTWSRLFCTPATGGSLGAAQTPLEGGKKTKKTRTQSSYTVSEGRGGKFRLRFHPEDEEGFSVSLCFWWRIHREWSKVMQHQYQGSTTLDALTQSRAQFTSVWSNVTPLDNIRLICLFLQLRCFKGDYYHHSTVLTTAREKDPVAQSQSQSSVCWAWGWAKFFDWWGHNWF